MKYRRHHIVDPKAASAGAQHLIYQWPLVFYAGLDTGRVSGHDRIHPR
ncbi:hypothetical protein ACFFJT_16160 [Dyella flava]|uniref:Uncharacterized protein n=1 Tax=Dyella flava TaxID=1920170 RepID=A0ABS2K297_9GAMM|nr:hypothetical protein [Dyella flava]MBM7125362.1 hypothetical protein [Dyella flava]